jgi:hypothetical protein
MTPAKQLSDLQQHSDTSGQLRDERGLVDINSERSD